MVLYPSQGFQICEKCGKQENIIIESDKPSFKDPPPEVAYFAYKRMNHFNECLARMARNGSPHRVFDAKPDASIAALRRMGFKLTPSETAAHMNLFETAHHPQSLSNL